MSDLDAMQAAYERDPDDAVTRAAVADWYEEHGDPESSSAWRVGTMFYNIGPDPADMNYVPEGRYFRVVYHYEKGDYDGVGYAVCERRDGKWDVVDMSHCSCYGPLSDWDVELEAASWDGVKTFAGDPDNILSNEALLAIVAHVEKGR